MKRDLYQEVTDQIVAALEAGTAPWIKPWTTTGATGLPENAVTHRAYRGINVLLLTIAARANGYATDQWLTFKQALEAGVPVRKGEKATRIYFFKMLEVKGDAAPAEERQAKVVPILREYYVFNVAQLSGELRGARKPTEPREFAGDAMVDAYLERTGARITHGGNAAFYQPSADSITMPPRESFKSAPHYYATALHELTHWTGHASRCDRLQKIARFGDEAYAFEELVAEMGAAFQCAQFGIAGELQHASYVANWIKVLKDDKRAIFRASSLAQKAVDFLEGITEEEELLAA